MKKVWILGLVLCILFGVCGCEQEESLNRYFVNFNTNGGTAVKQQVVIEGEKLSIPLEPTKKGYAFAGWFLGDNLYDFSKSVTSDMTLNAHWNEIIDICDRTCKSGYKLDNNCNCVKESTTKKTTKKNNNKTNVLSLSETNVTLVEGQKTFIETNATSGVTWKSNDQSIVEADNGYIIAKKKGNTTVVVKSNNGSAVLNVRVITKDREKLEAFISMMKPKIIKSVNTSLLYSFNGCKVINTANVASVSEIKIDNGVVTYLGNHLEGNLFSSYKVICGSESENVTIEHIINSI